MMPRQDLTPLLHARSVAIVGINPLPRFGGRVYQNLLNAGFAERGRIFGVNPRHSALFDQPCYAALRDLPERPDLAVLAVPNDRLLAALHEVIDLSIPAAVIFASAYSDPEAGQPGLQTRLTDLARAGGLALCGPNCMGFMALNQRLIISGYEVAPGVPPGRVSFITHSGTVFDTLWQNTRGLHFNYLVSAGNEIVTSMADYIQFALEDPATRVIGLFLETVRDPAAFRAALQDAAERDVPIVALKVGRSEQGARLAQAHSGALTGADAVYDALFAYYGVRRVKSLDEMLDTLELFSAGLRPPTRCITSIHDSGGERGLLVDLAEAEGVQFAPINDETRQKLAAVLEPGLLPVNPLDAWGTGNDFGRIYHECLQALDSDPAVGLHVWAADMYASGTITTTYLETAAALKPRLTRPLVFMPNVSASVNPELAARARRLGFPVLLGAESGLRAIRHLLDYGEYQRARPARRVAVHAPPANLAALRRRLQEAAGPLDESASLPFLDAYGLPCAARAVASSEAEAVAVAARLGYPVALKVTGQSHKSDQGGVCLNLNDGEALAQAYADLAARFGARVLVQRMAPAGVELLLGLVTDAQFGALLTIGVGGIFVEVLKDTRLLMLSATRAEVRAALLGLRGAALLHGVRGQPPTDVEAVVEAALRLAALAADLGDLIEALDINPLIAGPRGVVAVDALIIPRQTP
jgi:acyl-CoA synthetase (NDP forming)